ncbi:DUF262 domain-containing protein [Mammaliicoccus lentus]
MGIINSGFKAIGAFLTENKYHIPEYQRGYSWELTHLEDFWLDLIQLYEDESIKNHFLGQVVVHNDEEDTGKLYIIDGQQRTSTAIILLDVFRMKFADLYNEFKNIDADYESTDITTLYIGRFTDTKRDQKLILGDIDQQIFEGIIQSRDKERLLKINLKSLKPSEKRIYEARKYFNDKIDEILNSIEDPDEKFRVLKKIKENFIKNFKIMFVETNDINEAFIIFETLNARGKDLATSDLLKNHVFRTAATRLDSVKEGWTRMIENLENIDPTKFIRHYWNSQEKFAREKDLYKKIRNNIDSPKKAEVLIEDLVRSSVLYRSLSKPSENTYFQNQELNERLIEIKNLNAVSFYPIILAMEKEDFSETKINSVLEKIESLIVRNFVVSGVVANKYETEFAKIAYDISEYKLNSVEDILEALSELIIDDERFINNFEVFTVKNSPAIRYLLRKLNNYSNSETRIINDNLKIHIEHIMPKKPKTLKEWGVSEEDHKNYLNRLGNLTLLGQEYNKNATNKSFEEKKNIYKKSNITMTKELINFKYWNLNDIEKRQSKLSEIAIKIWEK